MTEQTNNNPHIPNINPTFLDDSKTNDYINSLNFNNKNKKFHKRKENFNYEVENSIPINNNVYSDKNYTPIDNSNTQQTSKQNELNELNNFDINKLKKQNLNYNYSLNNPDNITLNTNIIPNLIKAPENKENNNQLNDFINAFDDFRLNNKNFENNPNKPHDFNIDEIKLMESTNLKEISNHTENSYNSSDNNPNDLRNYYNNRYNDDINKIVKETLKDFDNNPITGDKYNNMVMEKNYNISNNKPSDHISLNVELDKINFKKEKNLIRPPAYIDNNPVNNLNYNIPADINIKLNYNYDSSDFSLSKKENKLIDSNNNPIVNSIYDSNNSNNLLTFKDNIQTTNTHNTYNSNINSNLNNVNYTFDNIKTNNSLENIQSLNVEKYIVLSNKENYNLKESKEINLKESKEIYFKESKEINFKENNINDTNKNDNNFKENDINDNNFKDNKENNINDNNYKDDKENNFKNSKENNFKDIKASKNFKETKPNEDMTITHVPNQTDNLNNSTKEIKSDNLKNIKKLKEELFSTPTGSELNNKDFLKQSINYPNGDWISNEDLHHLLIDMENNFKRDLAKNQIAIMEKYLDKNKVLSKMVPSLLNVTYPSNRLGVLKIILANLYDWPNDENYFKNIVSFLPGPNQQEADEHIKRVGKNICCCSIF